MQRSTQWHHPGCLLGPCIGNQRYPWTLQVAFHIVYVWLWWGHMPPCPWSRWICCDVFLQVPFGSHLFWLAGFCRSCEFTTKGPPLQCQQLLFGMSMKYLDTAPAVDMNRYECFGKNGRVMDSEWLKVISLFVPKVQWLLKCLNAQILNLGCLSIYIYMSFQALPKDSSKERVP